MKANLLARLLCTAASLLSLAASAADVIDIDGAQLAALSASGVPVVDIRTAGEWAETGVVPGSRLLTFYDEKGRSDPVAWLAKLRAIAGPDRPVVVICRSGNRTKAVSRLLAGPGGYERVYNVRDGIRAWIGEGRPLADGTAALAACRADRSC